MLCTSSLKLIACNEMVPIIFLVDLRMQVHRPKSFTPLLVCHDLAGGYHADAFPQGCGENDAFYLSHWHMIDTFVYFSHRFVTIPCSGWINCAHRHGVQVSAAALFLIM